MTGQVHGAADIALFERTRSVYESRSVEELSQIAHVKRFLERFQGDDVLRAALLGGLMSLDDAARACGCKLDLTTLQPVFNPAFTEHRKDATAEDWPLTHLWDSHLAAILALRDDIKTIGDTDGRNPAFDAWRSRQIARTAFELGVHAQGIVHPPITFELSSGCSVGCWFCGISAAKFGGNFSLADGGDVAWRETLTAAQSVLGRGMKVGFAYWATEPLDNPEYLEFLKIWHDVVGVVPQTTSAIPLRNLELTRSVLDLWKQHKCFPNRFSVLTTKILLKIHETFTPEELLGVELVLQGQGSASPKSGAGRAYQGAEIQRAGSVRVKNNTVVNGTIACVSGFLVNIVEKTVKLISPSSPSDRWPDGYIVVGERRYEKPEGLRDALESLIDEHMVQHLDPAKVIRFVSNINFFATAAGVGVESAHVRVQSKLLSVVGPLIDDGDKTPLEIFKIACEQGEDPLRVVAVINDVRSAGLIESLH